MIYLIGFQIKKENKIYAKIGVCERQLETRLKELQTGNPFKLKILAIIIKNNNNKKSYYEIEKELHYRHREKRLEGEWFLFSYREFKISATQTKKHKAIMYCYYDAIEKPNNIISTKKIRTYGKKQ